MLAPLVARPFSASISCRASRLQSHCEATTSARAETSYNRAVVGPRAAAPSLRQNMKFELEDRSEGGFRPARRREPPQEKAGTQPRGAHQEEQRQSIMVWLEDIVNDLADDAMEDPGGREMETRLTHAIEAACDTRQADRANGTASFRQAKPSGSASASMQTEAEAPRVVTGRLKSRRSSKQREFANAGDFSKGPSKFADLVWDEVEEVNAGALLSVVRG